MKDTDIMPWGLHKGKKMGNVPSGYLLYIYENYKCFGEVKSYIEANLDVIKNDTKPKL